MSVTAFGALFLPLTLFVLLFRRAWLLPVVCVAAVMQSPSVADFTLQGRVLGITPFFAVAVVIGFDLLLRAMRNRGLTLGEGDGRRLVLLWLAFAGWGMLCTLVLPFVFEGVPVYAPLDKEGAHAELVPLVWSASHMAQLGNLLLVVVMLLWLVQQRDDERLQHRMLLGIVLALVVATLVGLQQRLAWNGLLPMWESFWTSNPTYAQNYRSWAGPVPRVSWPFVEASYASAWYAGVLGGFLALFLASLRRHMALGLAMIAAFALANSLGATGLIAVIAFLLLTLAVSSYLALRYHHIRGVLVYQMSLGALVAACLGLATFLVLRHYGLLETAGSAGAQWLHGRSETLWGDLRPHADRHVFSLLQSTFGLGVGMGSNRGSSFLIALLGSVGVVGTALFIFATVYQMRLLAARLPFEANNPSLFFLGAGIAALLAVGIAIPDQNWPALWILLLGGVVCVTTRHPARGLNPLGRSAASA
jgi:hypothetical protein